MEDKTHRRPDVELQRSRMILAACDGAIDHQFPEIGAQVRIDIRPQGTPKWQVRLFASDSPTGIEAIARREADLAIVNPSAALTLAYRGTGWYAAPIPVRVITVMPQLDCVGLAVAGETGLEYLEDVAERKYPLHISLRGERSDHAIHLILADVLRAAGCPIHAIEAWGGSVSYDPGLTPESPRAGIPSRLDRVESGERTAIFDEGFPLWSEAALKTGMNFLSIRDATMERLTESGYRRHTVSEADLPGLDREMTTVDFSGWPVFCHADTPGKLVTSYCEGLEKHKGDIPWEQGVGPFPLDRMCTNPIEAPFDVPLHPAAEAFWRAQGYIT